MNKTVKKAVIAIMLSFFIMGFVDMVGIATNYMQQDFELTETLSGLLPSMVFLWFLILSVPTGMLMNKIGQRKTVLWSLLITLVALCIPFINYTFTSMLLFCCLLGIENTLIQVSLNPLISNIVRGDKLASSLTFGQFVKAIASFSAPIIATWAALKFGDWRYLFPIFGIVNIVALISLGTTSIQEEKKIEKTTFRQSFSLLGDKMILLCFIGIFCHVGLDVGVNVSAPKIFMERLTIDLSQAGFATSVYFLFRTVGSLSGSYLLSRVKTPVFYTISVISISLGLIGFLFAGTISLLYISVALLGVGNSNIFPIFFSQALLHKPQWKNEVSGLMIMGLSGGALFPFIMGLASDGFSSQIGGVVILSITAAYFLITIPKIQNTNLQSNNITSLLRVTYNQNGN